MMTMNYNRTIINNYNREHREELANLSEEEILNTYDQVLLQRWAKEYMTAQNAAHREFVLSMEYCDRVKDQGDVKPNTWSRKTYLEEQAERHYDSYVRIREFSKGMERSLEILFGLKAEVRDGQVEFEYCDCE